MKKGNRHLTLEDRVKIAVGLSERKSFSQIAREIGVDPTSISREVQKHRHKVHREKGKVFLDCGNMGRCPQSEGCPEHMACTKRTCRGCPKVCGKDCPHHTPFICHRLTGAPYVCHGCDRYFNCSFTKTVYDPKRAQEEYEEKLSSSRSGYNISEEDLATLDKVISHGVAKGQSVNHIYSYAADSLAVSQRSTYNYINGGILRAIRLDLPNAVKLKPRKKKLLKHRNDRRLYGEKMQGRTYADFLMFRDDHPEAFIVQMDCVEGKRDGNGKALLTLLFEASGAQIAIILDRQDEAHVTEAMKALKEKLGKETFQSLFQAILTDRGSEFLDPEEIEDGVTSRVFFCDPQRPDQKGACERNHHEVRRIFPKGTDITFSQEDADRMMNNINSVARKGLGNKTAYDVFLFLHGKETADRLGLVKVPARDVLLKPSCLTEQE